MIRQSDLANKIGKGGQTVSNHFKELLGDHKVSSNETWINNGRFYSDHAAKLIYKLHVERSHSKSNITRSMLITKLKDKDDLIKYLKNANDYLKNTNTVKDNQINKISNLLNHQQQLQLATKKSNDDLNKKVKHLRALSATPSNSKSATNTESAKPKKGGFWHRFLHL